MTLEQGFTIKTINVKINIRKIAIIYITRTKFKSLININKKVSEYVQHYRGNADWVRSVYYYIILFVISVVVCCLYSTLFYVLRFMYFCFLFHRPVGLK